MSEKEIITLDGTRVDTLYATVEKGTNEDGTAYEKKQAVAPRTFTSAVTNDNGINLETRLAEMQTQINNAGGNVVGDVADLITDNKETLVNAINEVKNGTESINNNLQNGYPTQILIKDGSDTDKLFALRCYPESWGAGASIGIENLDMTWYKRLQIQEDDTLHFVIKDEGSEDVRNMRLMTNENVINPNLLINSDFRNPINQRGQAEYTGNNIYTVDRWRTGGGGVNGKIIVNDGYVTVERTTASLYLSFFQKIAEDIVHLSNQTVTLSAKVRTASNYCRLSINVNDGTELNYNTFDGTGDWQIITKTVVLPQIDSYISLGLSNNPAAPVGDSCDIAWIKLEVGSAATPFVSPDPATELLRCQRYYLNMYSDEGFFFYVSNTQDSPYMLFPVKMRVIPDITISGEGDTYIIDTNNTVGYSPYGFNVDGSGLFKNGGSVFIDSIICDAEIY